jgi:hypothetical protein
VADGVVPKQQGKHRARINAGEADVEKLILGEQLAMGVSKTLDMRCYAGLLSVWSSRMSSWASAPKQVCLLADACAPFMAACTAAPPPSTAQSVITNLPKLCASRVAAADIQLLPDTLCTPARTTLQDLSLWLYSLALLRITPSPLWCTSYVEASYSRLTARSTHSQVRSQGRTVHLSVSTCGVDQTNRQTKVGGTTVEAEVHKSVTSAEVSKQ